MFFSISGNPSHRFISTGRINYCLYLSDCIIHSNQLEMLKYRLKLTRSRVGPGLQFPTSSQGPGSSLLVVHRPIARHESMVLSIDTQWNHLGIKSKQNTTKQNITSRGEGYLAWDPVWVLSFKSSQGQANNQLV